MRDVTPLVSDAERGEPKARRRDASQVAFVRRDDVAAIAHDARFRIRLLPEDIGTRSFRLLREALRPPGRRAELSGGALCCASWPGEMRAARRRAELASGRRAAARTPPDSSSRRVNWVSRVKFGRSRSHPSSIESLASAMKAGLANATSAAPEPEPFARLEEG